MSESDIDLSVLPNGVELLLLAKFDDYNPDVGLRDCPDCAAIPGATHERGCDVVRCSVCKQQALQGCVHVWARAYDQGDEYAVDPEWSGFGAEDYEGVERHDPTSVRWNGVWPGTLECIRQGFFCFEDRRQTTPHYWAPCGPDHPRAQADLNRLAVFQQTGKDPGPW